MKYLLITLLFFASCEIPKPKIPLDYKRTSIYEHEEYKPPIYVDSSLVYFAWHANYMCASQKAQEYEIKYLRTENDKYRILGNQCYDSVHKYGVLLTKLQARLKQK